MLLENEIMIQYKLFSLLPHLLEKHPELFSNQDLQELDDTINLLESKSDDEAKKIFSDFLKQHRHIRDALRKLEPTKEINNLPPSTSEQYGVTNIFPRLRQIIKDNQEKRNMTDEPKKQTKTS